MSIDTRARSAVRSARRVTATSTPDLNRFLRDAAVRRRGRRAGVIVVVVAVLAIVLPLSGVYLGNLERISPAERGRDDLQTPAPTPGKVDVKQAPGARSGEGAPGPAVGALSDGRPSNAGIAGRTPATRNRILFDDGVGTSRGIYVIDGGGSGRRQIATGSSPDWSPNGRRIAFVRAVDDCLEGDCWQTWVMNADGSGQRLLTQGSAPDWSPDGKRIAFVRFMDKDDDDELDPYIYFMNADGSGVRPLVGAAGDSPDWSPDGRKIAFIASIEGWNYGCDGSQKLDLVRIRDVNGPGIVDIEPPGCFVKYPEWSPDGKQIAFSSSRHRNTLDIGIYVASADGLRVKRVSPAWEGSEPRAAFMPTWSPDGKRIAYTFDADGSSYAGGLILCRHVGMGGSWDAWAHCRAPGPAPEQIYVMNADGTGARHITQGRMPDFSP